MEAMEEIRRAGDGELVGFVTGDGEGWLALTIFHGVLARTSGREEAAAIVERDGLRCLAERWRWFSRRTGEWRLVLPQEVAPGRVRVAVGYYALPGVPTETITAADLAAGDRLVLASAGDPDAPSAP